MDQWEQMLEGHQDRWWADYLVRGIREGFRVGFSGYLDGLRAGTRNMVSAGEQPQVVQDYLDREVKEGRIWEVGSVQEATDMGVHCSPFGVIPKRSSPGKWRLIVDLSAPEGLSVNDGIPKELCSLGYMSVDDVVAQVLKMGRGSEMAKIDVQQAYRNVPVHPDDRHLLGMEWQGQVFVDGALPFGLRSAPLLFTALGDAIQWVAEAKGVSWLGHYIDDFVTVGEPNSGTCSENLDILKGVCKAAGMPLEEEKEEGPSTAITFLGLELDTVNLVVRLPEEKLKELRATLQSWRGMKSCRKRELLSIIGSLSHACKAIRAGRSYLRRLIDLSTTVNRLSRRVRLNTMARSDLLWWWEFSQEWNGVAMMVSVNSLSPDIELVTDASGSWGCGAVCGTQWFQLEWDGLGSTKEYGIMAKELLPIVVAAAVWGGSWAGKTVRARCDNQSVVATINTGSCREAETMHLRRCLAFLEAKGQFHIMAVHIRGVDNVVADALSRNRAHVACSLLQGAEQEPVAVPEGVLDVVARTKPDWLDEGWRKLWSSSSPKGWHQPHGGLTP